MSPHEPNIELATRWLAQHIEFMRRASRNRWKYHRLMIDSDCRENRKLFYRLSQEERASAIYSMERAIWWKRHIEELNGAP